MRIKRRRASGPARGPRLDKPSSLNVATLLVSFVASALLALVAVQFMDGPEPETPTAASLVSRGAASMSEREVKAVEHGRAVSVEAGSGGRLPPAGQQRPSAAQSEKVPFAAPPVSVTMLAAAASAAEGSAILA